MHFPAQVWKKRIKKPTLKKFLIFFPEESFSDIFEKWNFLAYFFSKENFLILWEMELYLLKGEKALIFQKETFWAWKIKKNSAMKKFLWFFQKKNNSKIKKAHVFLIIYFRKWKFPAPSLKNFRRELSELKKQTRKTHSEKVFLIFQRETFKTWKTKMYRVF